ncbi:pentatricopeptide repeat-containing protein At1g74630 [Nicotiana tomentosiformis]|uniref:pentatricopeptide repeat-containing protein At1g74630 n=1 Tax=Nicotiana tomentosiformis TaxID=4098 RepID=UPI00051BCD6B|nr:pentatricopeptide repeat-containing protein At1g74630 [Nicotiana tomentosiformis]XP_009599818.1 pentatricopeptide repeat-containing protein At1g74630 [Nicotiana tomentosiformis]XP_009599819.1 pentatricopeptide repeat-containing protein At1g74630 [Nicotiana tomentosiformis]XP_018626024.1 pentatricopeptide repeat-containing protein At1g74630 [Nicotiana tomentosiformis]XP_018626025.1 pentatricopeptide repeat-containing protein At1g74630 [Nicotiana tomentosiformis]XP_033511784.1 pentatricopepti
MNSAAENLCLSLLSNCRTLRNLKQIHAFVYKSGLETDPLISAKILLISAVQISDAIDYARRLFIHNPNPDVFMYNSLIRGESESDSPNNSVSSFARMLRESYSPPDSFSFAFALKAAANLRCLKTGFQLHCQAMVRGLDTHLFVGTTLVSMYGECGFVVFARKVFDEMNEPNVVAWNAIITAYFRGNDLSGADRLFGLIPCRDLTTWNVMLAGHTKAGDLERAKGLFLRMPSRDDVSWSTMIVGFARNGYFDEALWVFRELVGSGNRSNEVSLTGVLSACAQAGAFEFGKILHAFIEKMGFAWISSVNNALLDTYSKCGNVLMARLVFERMPGKKSIVSWTSMIAGLAMQGYGEEAIKLFHKMEESGTRPDEITFISILYACSHAGLLERGHEIFSKMTGIYNIEPTIEHYGCMVDLYGRAGQLHKAYNFVVQMPVPPNAIIWRTLLGACSFFGDIELAEQVKKRLSELDPDNSGDHVLLSNIYAVAGKWKDVDTVRRLMAEKNMKKTPGWSMIEVDKVMYSFVAGDKLNDITEEAYNKLSEITLKLKVEGGYVPEVGSVLHDIEEEEKEDTLSKHSEKLAVAFGMARLCKGRTIRIVKNLRVCKDCHSFMKSISKVYELDIVVRDRSRFHSFKEGSCSCRDYW